MVCLISLLVLGMRSIHPIILQLVSHQFWRLPSLCHNSPGFVLPYSWSGLNAIGSPLIYTVQRLCQSDMQNSFFHLTIRNMLKRAATHLQLGTEK